MQALLLLLAQARRQHGQDGVAHAEERLGDQARADHRAGIALAGEEHLPPPARGQEVEGREVPPKIDQLALVVLMADMGDDVPHDVLEVLIADAVRTADADVVVRVLAEGARRHAVGEVGLQHEMTRLVAVDVLEGAPAGMGRSGEPVPDVEARVRPGALRQVFDDLGEPRLAFHEEHVAHAHVLLQVVEVVGNPALVVPHLADEEADHDVGQRPVKPQRHLASVRTRSRITKNAKKA